LGEASILDPVSDVTSPVDAWKAHFITDEGNHVFIFPRAFAPVLENARDGYAVTGVVIPRACFACGSADVEKQSATIPPSHDDTPQVPLWACTSHRPMTAHETHAYFHVEGFPRFVVITASNRMPASWISAFATQNTTGLLSMAREPGQVGTIMTMVSKKDKVLLKWLYSIVTAFLGMLALSGLLAAWGASTTFLVPFLYVAMLGATSSMLVFPIIKYFIIPARQVSTYASFLDLRLPKP
jgi:hypothetical protein